jgi:hypothetical protein
VIISTDEQTPVPSLSAIWPCAPWYEREAWDMYGILFDGQPDLRRLLDDYGFGGGTPLRKGTFPLTGHVEVRYDEDAHAVVYEPVARLTAGFPQLRFPLALGMACRDAARMTRRSHLTRAERGQLRSAMSGSSFQASEAGPMATAADAAQP